MSLSSNSSLDEIRAAYIDNADYDIQANLSMCATFIKACRILLLKTPTSQSRGADGSIEFDTRMIENQQKNAMEYYRVNKRGTTVSVGDMSGGRYA